METYVKCHVPADNYFNVVWWAFDLKKCQINFFFKWIKIQFNWIAGSELCATSETGGDFEKLARHQRIMCHSCSAIRWLCVGGRNSGGIFFFSSSKTICVDLQVTWNSSENNGSTKLSVHLCHAGRLHRPVRPIRFGQLDVSRLSPTGGTWSHFIHLNPEIKINFKEFLIKSMSNEWI